VPKSGFVILKFWDNSVGAEVVDIKMQLYSGFLKFSFSVWAETPLSSSAVFGFYFSLISFEIHERRVFSVSKWNAAVDTCDKD